VPLLPIDFADYHRTVIAYHGTNVEASNRLVAGEPFEESDEDDEWFGKGCTSGSTRFSKRGGGQSDAMGRMRRSSVRFFVSVAASIFSTRETLRCCDRFTIK
jgi:hypothetical protein